MLYNSRDNSTELKVVHLNKRLERSRTKMLESMNDKPALKDLKKRLADQAKKKLKHKNKKASKVFVLDFYGDVKASKVDQLREEISTIVSVAKKGDEVIIRLESAGGMVHAYGLAAAQLIRLKDAGLTVTVCVDKVAASGGYMMSVIADKIVASPFAVLGSIGVVAQLPNFNKILKKNDIDFEMFTAGDFKRTVTMFGENDDDKREKFQEELEQTHVLFKEFVSTYRPKLELDNVATGEHWYATDALKLGLVDEIKTSDSYLLDVIKNKQVYALSTEKKPTLAEKLGFAEASASLITMTIDKLPEYLKKIDDSFMR